jgi:hypothetical protein
MSTQEIERELAEVLHRHAEDAMAGTDTHTEHERFREQLEMGADRQPRNRWAVGVAVAAASAVVVGISVWALGGQGDNSGIPPTGPSEDVSDAEIAQGFVEAYGDGDLVRAATYLAPGHVPYPEWELHVERNVAWDVTYDFEPCEAKTQTPFGPAVLCPFDIQVLHSEAVGRGPFTGNSFTVYVKDGAVTQAEDQMPWETNGIGDHVEEVWSWVGRQYPQHWEFMSLDEPEVPPAEWSRWLRLWERASDAYFEAHAEPAE